MSGIGVKIEVDDKAAIAALRRLQDVDARALRPALKTIGNDLVDRWKDRFLEERGPDGQPWAPLSPGYARRKAGAKNRNNRILQYSGLLFRSIHAEPLTGDELRVGSDRVYAAAHQFGRAEINLPARPFIGLDAGDVDEITATVLDELAALAAGTGS